MPHRSISVSTLALTAALAAFAGEFRISGPYMHDNLSIFLLHGESRNAARRMLTLQEAMEQKLAIVYETGTVQQLSIENTSPVELYIQAGDIVKGGRQDRVLVTDLVLPARSGRVPVSSFCVEQGRWRKRGAEADDRFNASSQVVAGKQLKMAVKDKRQQGEVWKEVANAQARLFVGSGTGTGLGAGLASSSMQLTLEHKAVVDGTAPYIGVLSRIVDRHSDVVGFAYAINGEMESADAYLSSDLFRRMWPKLLKASAVEALAARGKEKPVTAVPGTDAVKKMLSSAVRRGEGHETEVLLFETREGGSSTAWLHRNYIVK